MDPLTGALTFSTVVSLVSQFRSERGADAQSDFNEFLEWLVTNQHEGLKTLIEGNAQTTIGIKVLLQEQHDELKQRLDSLDAALAAYASALPGFADISGALRPDAVLSQQALSILKQFDESGASKVLGVFDTGRPALLCISSARRQIEIDDVRFLEDDLATLVELGLLRHDFTDSGKDLYIFTRAASNLVRSIPDG